MKLTVLFNFYCGILLTIKIFIMNEISIKQAKETHDALREILIKYGCEEYGDCIVDEISWLFSFPTTIDVEPEEED